MGGGWGESCVVTCEEVCLVGSGLASFLFFLLLLLLLLLQSLACPPMPKNTSTFSSWQAGGYVLVVVFAFVLGFGATMAELALQVLGGQVDSLTRGRIPKMRLVVTVAVGVGGGIALGCVRVLYDIEIMWMLLPLYTVAAVLMLASDDEYVGISFDSGGATTGAVTSPLILALAVALGSARGVVGFGMLALASVGPILTVLLLGLVTGCCDRRRARRRATAALEGVRYGALREDANTRGVGGGGRGR